MRRLSRWHVRVYVALTALWVSSCASETRSPTMPQSTGSVASMFGVYPDAVMLGPGDRGWLFAQAAALPNDPKDVTSATRWESSNPSVAIVQGNTITAILPGEADIRGSFQLFSGSTHVTVFSPSLIRGFSMPAELLCSPDETFSWSAQAVLENGVAILPSTIVWRSRDENIVAVTPIEVQNSTGTIGTDAKVTCRAPGTATFEATYSGHTAVARVTVRAATREMP